MSLKYSTDHKQQQRPWLKAARDKRAKRTTNLGKQSIDLLRSESKEISFANIARTSKTLDPEGKGIHPNSIRSNSELYEYYKIHSKTYKKAHVTRRRKEFTKARLDLDFSHIKLNRDLNTVRLRYQQMTKDQLIERLISTEQYIAHSTQAWLVKQFESFPKV